MILSECGERAARETTQRELTENVAVNMTAAKTTMPSGSSRERLAGNMYGLKAFCARCARNRIAPDAMSRNESSVDAINDSEPLTIVANSFNAASEMLVKNDAVTSTRTGHGSFLGSPS